MVVVACLTSPRISPLRTTPPPTPSSHHLLDTSRHLNFGVPTLASQFLFPPNPGPANGSMRRANNAALHLSIAAPPYDLPAQEAVGNKEDADQRYRHRHRHPRVNPRRFVGFGSFGSCASVRPAGQPARAAFAHMHVVPKIKNPLPAHPDVCGTPSFAAKTCVRPAAPPPLPNGLRHGQGPRDAQPDLLQSVPAGPCLSFFGRHVFLAMAYFACIALHDEARRLLLEACRSTSD